MILIRADANEIIGTGHVMRCLSIAWAFAKRGEEVAFVTADHRGDGLIQQNGFSSICLDSERTDMENEGINHIIIKFKPKLLIIDSYYVTEKYLTDLGAKTHLVYFDDMNVRRWNVDVLINYNIIASVFDYTWYEGTKTKLLLYPKYAPLRDEFKNSPKHEIKNVSDILISAGGSDPERITEQLILEVCPKQPDITFHFIVGALNPRLEDIKKLAEKQRNAILHINEKHMSELMKSCDIAISAAGTTLYELCATGIPTITYTLADNQLVAAEQFDRQGIMLSAGDCRGDDKFTGRLEGLLQKLIIEEHLRRVLSEKMQVLVDGYGADRIANELLHLGCI